MSPQEGKTQLGRHCGILNILLASMGRKVKLELLAAHPKKYSNPTAALGSSSGQTQSASILWFSLAFTCKSDDCSVLSLYFHGRGKHPCPINLDLVHVTCFGLMVGGELNSALDLRLGHESCQ